MILRRVILGRLRVAWNTLFGARSGTRPVRVRRPLLGGMLAMVLAALVAIGLGGVFGQLAGQGMTARETSVVLGLVLTAALFGMLLFDLHEVVATLVVDSDLELLRRAPIPPAALYLLKLADALPRTSLLVVVVVVPAVLAYHVFYPLPLWAWPVFAIHLLALWAVPLGVGAAIAMLVLRRVPPRRAREALGLLSTVTLFVLWLANSFLIPRLATTEEDPIGRFRDVAGTEWLRALTPGHWTARALAAAADGAPVESALATVMVVAMAALALALSAAVASRHLEALQSAIAEGAGARRGSRSRRARGAPADRAARPGFLRAVLARDGRLFLRDWVVLGDVLTTTLLWTLLPLLGAPLYQASSHALARAMLLGLTVGLGYEVGARALPFERQGLVWVRLGPVPAWRWIAAKLAGAAALSFPLMAIAACSMILTMGLGGRETLATLAIALPAMVLALSIGIWTGAAFGRTDWSHPRAMLTVTGRAAATLLLLAQAAAWLALGAVAGPTAGARFGVMLWAPALAAGLLSLIPLSAACARIERREW